MLDPDEEALLALQNDFLTTKDKPAAEFKSSSFRLSRNAQSEASCGKSAAGERVELNLDDTHRQASSSGTAFIKDIVERDPGEANIVAPSLGLQKTLAPRKINWRGKRSGDSKSRFANARKTNVPQGRSGNDFNSLSREIEAENKEKIRGMTDAEIEAERNELNATLNPGILAALMRRRKKKNVDEDDAPDFGPSFISEQITSIPQVVPAGTPRLTDGDRETGLESSRNRLDCIDLKADEDYTSAAEALGSMEQTHVHTADCLHTNEEQTNHIHFPSAPEVRELDPTSDTFLEDLKAKYYPDLTHDPASLAWMKAPTESEDLADYHESHESLMPAQLRFDFKGNFVAPRTSREVESDIGLHHHADAPLAAGYTIPELAHLCRSAYPAQACIAIQTIGRVMFKVGKHFYGASISGKLQTLLDKSMVERTLLERARDRHMGVSSYATEALWQANLGREGRVIEGQ